LNEFKRRERSELKRRKRNELKRKKWERRWREKRKRKDVEKIMIRRTSKKSRLDWSFLFKLTY
jgi:hypothetical protein